MTAAEFSLIAVTLGFIALVLWVYWPSRRQRLESLGHIPLDDDTDTGRETGAGMQTNKDKEL